MSTSVKPVPDRFHTITPYLVIKNAAEAIEFYKRAFGAEEVARMPGPDGKSVLHAELKIGDSMLMMCEEFPNMGTKSPLALGGSPCSIHLYVTDADAVFQRAVDAGATAKMPPADMFWGDRFGKLTDPFGHDWSIATHIKDLTPEELAKAGAEAMANMDCS